MATLRGRVLLGWLPRDQAVNFLLNDCAFDPPIDSAAAERMWRDYRDRAEAVPERQATLPMRLPLNQAEQAHTQSFLQFLNRQGQHTIREVIKIDLSQLAVIQHVVVTEMAENYGPSVQTTDGWMRTCLPVTIKQGQIRTNFSQGPRMNSAADIDLPHAECILVRDADGKFVVAE